MHASAPLLQGHRKPVGSIESFEFGLSTAMPCHERVGNGVFARTVVESLLTANGGWIGNLSCSRATTWFDRVCQWISGKLHEYPSTHRWSSALLRSCTGAGRSQEAPNRRTTRADGPACRYHVCDGGGAHSGDTMRPDGVQHFLVANTLRLLLGSPYGLLGAILPGKFRRSRRSLMSPRLPSVSTVAITET